MSRQRCWKCNKLEHEYNLSTLGWCRECNKKDEQHEIILVTGRSAKGTHYSLFNRFTFEECIAIVCTHVVGSPGIDWEK